MLDENSSKSCKNMYMYMVLQLLILQSLKKMEELNNHELPHDMEDSVEDDVAGESTSESVVEGGSEGKVARQDAREGTVKDSTVFEQEVIDNNSQEYLLENSHERVEVCEEPPSPRGDQLVDLPLPTPPPPSPPSVQLTPQEAEVSKPHPWLSWWMQFIVVLYLHVRSRGRGSSLILFQHLYHMSVFLGAVQGGANATNPLFMPHAGVTVSSSNLTASQMNDLETCPLRSDSFQSDLFHQWTYFIVSLLAYIIVGVVGVWYIFVIRYPPPLEHEPEEAMSNESKGDEVSSQPLPAGPPIVCENAPLQPFPPNSQFRPPDHLIINNDEDPVIPPMVSSPTEEDDLADAHTYNSSFSLMVPLQNRDDGAVTVAETSAFIMEQKQREAVTLYDRHSFAILTKDNVLKIVSDESTVVVVLGSKEKKLTFGGKYVVKKASAYSTSSSASEESDDDQRKRLLHSQDQDDALLFGRFEGCEVQKVTSDGHKANSAVVGLRLRRHYISPAHSSPDNSTPSMPTLTLPNPLSNVANISLPPPPPVGMVTECAFPSGYLLNFGCMVEMNDEITHTTDSIDTADMTDSSDLAFPVNTVPATPTSNDTVDASVTPAESGNAVNKAYPCSLDHSEVLLKPFVGPYEPLQ